MKKRLAMLMIAAFLAGAPASFSAAAPFDPYKDPQDRNRTLVGIVFGSGEQPLQKAIVYLKNTKTLGVTTYISDPDGSYRFPALSPNVDYEVHAEYKGAHSDTKTLSAFDNRKQAKINLHIKTNP